MCELFAIKPVIFCLLCCLWILDERCKVSVATGMDCVPEACCRVSITLDHVGSCRITSACMAAIQSLLNLSMQGLCPNSL